MIAESIASGVISMEYVFATIEEQTPYLLPMLPIKCAERLKQNKHGSNYHSGLCFDSDVYNRSS